MSQRYSSPHSEVAELSANVLAPKVSWIVGGCLSLGLSMVSSFVHVHVSLFLQEEVLVRDLPHLTSLRA